MDTVAQGPTSQQLGNTLGIGKAAGGGAPGKREWRHPKKRSPSRPAPPGQRRLDRARARRTRYEEAVSRGELPREVVPEVTRTAFRGWDDVQVPRALGWSGLSRGAQLLAVRLFSKGARGEGPKPKASSKAARRRDARRRFAKPLVTRKGYAGRVERPRAYLASMAGGVTLRSITNWLSQLEAAGLVKRQWKIIRAAAGKVQGSRLIVWLRLAKWWQLLTTGCKRPNRAERNFRDSTSSPLRGEVVGGEAVPGGRAPVPPDQFIPRAAPPEAPHPGTGGVEGPAGQERAAPHPLGASTAAPGGASPRCEGCGHAAVAADPCVCWGRP